MKTVMNKYPDMDIQPLKNAIEEKANLLLTEITEENLKTFSQTVKIIAESAMEQYIFKVYNLYTEGEFKIADINILLSFTDYHSGYQSKMLAWNKSHPIQLHEERVELLEQPMAPRINKYQPVITAGIGTVVAISLYLFSNAWVVLVTEILALTLAYRQQKDRLLELTTYENQLGMKRTSLINGLTEDLVKWLELGKEYSNSILHSHNL